jgi:nucleotide-binding universal stress UspA family protein
MEVLATTTRISLKNVLCATDFSPTAQTALAFAQGIARRYGSKLFAVHVVSPAKTQMLPPESWGPVQQSLDEAASREMAQLDAQLQGLRHQVDVCSGSVWTVISKLIETNHIDLLVMGTHGRSGFERLLMGSVAEEIFRQAPCPVLTVGPLVPADTARETGFSQIVLAADFSSPSPAAAPYALALAQDYEARLTLVHVVPQQVGSLALEDVDILDRTKALHNLISADTEESCRPECVVRLGDPASNILGVAKERNADLIVMGVRPAKGHLAAATHLGTGAAHTVVSFAPCPVLTIRDSRLPGAPGFLRTIAPCL